MHRPNEPLAEALACGNIAHVLRQARASLKDPSRPYTPAERREHIGVGKVRATHLLQYVCSSQGLGGVGVMRACFYCRAEVSAVGAACMLDPDVTGRLTPHRDRWKPGSRRAGATGAVVGLLKLLVPAQLTLLLPSCVSSRMSSMPSMPSMLCHLTVLCDVSPCCQVCEAPNACSAREAFAPPRPKAARLSGATATAV